MKATLPSGKCGLLTVDLKAEAAARRARARDAGSAESESADGARADGVEPPVLWTEGLPPPPERHDPAGRNER
jgi:hypothetical protein